MIAFRVAGWLVMAMLAALALTACSPPGPHAMAARPWHAAMTVSASHCGRLPGGGKGLEYRFRNFGGQPAAPLVTVTFTSEGAPDGAGVAGEGQTGAITLAGPGTAGTGTAQAPEGLAFDGCVITGWQVAEVKAR